MTPFRGRHPERFAVSLVRGHRRTRRSGGISLAIMKTRVTVTLDPEVLRMAKAVAQMRRTNVSALIEESLRHAAEESSPRPAKSFVQRWIGKFEIRDDADDELLQALKKRYHLHEADA
jgi:hypothetical protein